MLKSVGEGESSTSSGVHWLEIFGTWCFTFFGVVGSFLLPSDIIGMFGELFGKERGGKSAWMMVPFCSISTCREKGIGRFLKGRSAELNLM